MYVVGRKLRVSYSNNSNLKTLAKEIGQDTMDFEPSFKQEADTVQSLQLHEAWDILEYVKRLADEGTGQRARSLLSAYPQLVPALLQIQVRHPCDPCCSLVSFIY